MVFLPVRAVPGALDPGARDATRYVVTDGRRRTELAAFLPRFSDHFSSPAVADGILYYWGLGPQEDGMYALHAQRYDALARRVESCRLATAEIATDNRGHFHTPRPENGGIRFVTQGMDLRLRADLARTPADGSCLRH